VRGIDSPLTPFLSADRTPVLPPLPLFPFTSRKHRRAAPAANQSAQWTRYTCRALSASQRAHTARLSKSGAVRGVGKTRVCMYYMVGAATQRTRGEQVQEARTKRKRKRTDRENSEMGAKRQRKQEPMRGKRDRSRRTRDKTPGERGGGYKGKVAACPPHGPLAPSLSFMLTPCRLVPLQAASNRKHTKHLPHLQRTPHRP